MLVHLDLIYVKFKDKGERIKGVLFSAMDAPPGLLNRVPTSAGSKGEIPVADLGTGATGAPLRQSHP